MVENGIVCSTSRSGDIWDNAVMESFFSSLKTERTARKTRPSGFLSPVEFERKVGLA
jgi:putative transposase